MLLFFIHRFGEIGRVPATLLRSVLESSHHRRLRHTAAVACVVPPPPLASRRRLKMSSSFDGKFSCSALLLLCSAEGALLLLCSAEGALLCSCSCSAQLRVLLLRSLLCRFRCTAAKAGASDNAAAATE